MNARLVITTAVLTNFGGTRTQKRVEFPSTGLVVLEGSNEAGKSTVAEAVAWLLAAPSPNSETVARMGDRDDMFEARLEGTLDGAPFNVSAKFKIGANNKARRTATSVVIAGQETTLEEFHQRIGLAEPTLYHHVFRIEGADGHRVGDADEVVAQAGAGVFGPIDPHEVADGFGALAKERGKSSARAADSVRNREAAISDLQSELDEAGRNASEYREQIDAVEDANARKAKVAVGLKDLRQTQQAFGSAKSIAGKMAKLRTLRSSLEQEPVVPAGWAAVVSSLGELEFAHGGLEGRRSQLERAIRDGAEAAARNERNIEQLALVVIDEAVTTQLMSAAQQAEQAETNERDLRAEVANAVETVSSAHNVAGDALAALGPVAHQQDFDPTLARLDEGGMHLAQKAEAVRNAESNQEQAQQSATSARVALEAAKTRLEATEQQYRAFNAGVDAEALLAGAGVPAALTTPEVTDRGFAGWFAPVALAVVTVAAAISGQYVLAGVAAVGAVVAAVLQGRRAKVPTTPEAGPSEGHIDAAREAAMDVRDARRVIPELEESLTIAEGNVTDTADLVAARRNDLATALGAAGLPNDIEPGSVATVVETWRRAAQEFDKWRSASIGLKELEANLDVAESDTAAATRRLEAELARFDLEPGGATAVAASLSALGRDADLARAAVSAQDELTDLERRVEELLTPVGLATDDAADTIQRATTFASAMDERAEIERKVAELEQSIATALEASATVAELVESEPDTSRLEAQERETGEQIDEVDQELQQLITEAATAQTEANSLLNRQKITDLQEQISAHDAAANDLAIEAFAASMAHLLVEEEADREERSRRPVLIERTSEIATTVAREWSGVRAVRPPTGERGVRLVVDMEDGKEVPAHQLSTGARTLLYLSLRIAVADGLSARSQLALPLLCDDPLVNVDGQRAPEIMKVLSESAKDRQVILMTCHTSTSDLARQFGGIVESLDR